MNRYTPPADSLWHSDDDRTIDDAFRQFDREHPEVFRLFRDYAEQIRGRGFSRYSSDAILHRIRWWHHVEQADREFKINDHFSSRYARLLIEVDPTFAGFFELRRLRSA